MFVVVVKKKGGGWVVCREGMMLGWELREFNLPVTLDK